MAYAGIDNIRGSSIIGERECVRKRDKWWVYSGPIM